MVLTFTGLPFLFDLYLILKLTSGLVPEESDINLTPLDEMGSTDSSLPHLGKNYMYGGGSRRNKLIYITLSKLVFNRL